MTRPKLLDVVRLRAHVDRWPAGTLVTIVDDFPGGFTVEVADGGGLGLLDTLIDVPESNVVPIRREGAA